MAVVTNMGVMKFDELSKEMYLAEYYPGIEPEKIVQNTGFPIDISRALPFDPPTGEELRILRDEVDPQRLLLGAPAE
jgi:glutaconate CoA-transferase subunit B